MPSDTPPDRDHVLGTALRELPVPEHVPDFFERLESAMRDEQVRQPPQVSWRSWLPRLAVPAAAAAVVAAVLLVVGQDSRPTLPEVVTAPEATPFSRTDLERIVPQRSEAPAGWIAYGEPEHDEDRGVILGMTTMEAAQLLTRPEAAFRGAELTRFRIGEGEESRALVYAGYLFETSLAAATAFQTIVDDHSIGIDGAQMQSLPAPALGAESARLRGDWHDFYPGQDRTITLVRLDNVVLDFGTTGLSLDEHERLVEEWYARAEAIR